MKNLIALIVLLSFFVLPIKGQQKNIDKLDTLRKITTPGLKLDTTLIIKIKNKWLGKIDAATARQNRKDSILKIIRQIDSVDLRITKCDFEKDANAMILLDEATMSFGLLNLELDRHKRIKIFNDNGKDEANIIIPYNNQFGEERIYGIEAETVNLINGKIEVTKLDPKLIYYTQDDKNRSVIKFTMPNIKSGSVIDYSYTWVRPSLRNIPEWFFQHNLPTLYSEIIAYPNPIFKFSVLKRTSLPFDKDTIHISGIGHVWAMKNVPSAKDEPYMRSLHDALQSIKILISQINYNSKKDTLLRTWASLGKEIAEYKKFNKLFDQRLPDEDIIIKQANALKTNEEKIAYLFNYVKGNLRWNEDEDWISEDGIKAIWKRKSGSSGEINMILHHLLKLSGINAHPMLVSTRENGQILLNYADIYQINKLVVYVPIDSIKFQILDASNKFNVYNEIPYDLLNSYGLVLDKDNQKYELRFIKKDEPSKQSVFINAEIKPDGTMTGTASIASFSYNKFNDLVMYKNLDEKKYFEYLTNNDNNLKIKSLKLENAEVDSLPLIQNIEFNLELPGTDDKYIYFNPNLFTDLYSNPFIIKSRVSDIDFGCNKSYKISGRYTIPKGYKVESLPKSINLTMEDKSIIFKRLVVIEDSLIQVSYNISFKRSFFAQAEYQGIYNYFKKMDETLNEPIVLKKQ